MYEFLIFDADHTLFDFDRAEKEAIIRIMKDFNHLYSDGLLMLYKDINLKLWIKFEKNEITQKEIKAERFSILFEKAGIKGNPAIAAENYLLYLSQGNYIIPGADDVIFKLKSKYKLGLLTNGISKVQHPRLADSIFRNVFDAYVISGDVGINKPDPGIFKILSDKVLYYDKSKMLMIGDSLTSDIAGGINFGIDTCWYNPGKKLNKTVFKPTYEISELKDIFNILVGEGSI